MSEPPAKPSVVNERARRALANDRTIDITTTGRRSGRPRRIEIWFHNLGGRMYISGLPGQRDWYANLVADPEFVFHLKQTAQIDLPARARPVTDPPERRRVLSELLAGVGREANLESWAATSPIIEVQFLDRDRPSSPGGDLSRRCRRDPRGVGTGDCHRHTNPQR